MPRRANPYPHRGWFVSNVGGQRHKLCRVSEGITAAQESLDRLKVERHNNGGRAFPALTTEQMAALFLQHAEVECSGPTFNHYQSKLKPFVSLLGAKPARQLHLSDGIAYKKTLSEYVSKQTGNFLGPVSINHHLRAAKRVLNWAVDEMGYLPKNNWKKIKLLPEDGRERTITDEFRSLVRRCSDSLFKQILLTLRWTAARPGEIRELTWSMVRWDINCLVIPPKKHKTGSTTKKRRPRIIPMIPLVQRLLRFRQARRGDNELIFADPKGNQWKVDTFSQRFARLRKRAQIAKKEGETLVLYSTRHTRLTELAPGVSAAVLQEVAGHTTFATTQRYLHLASQQLYNAVLDAEQHRYRRPK
jgi:integrase